MRIWNFQGHWKNSMRKFQGSSKKEKKFIGVTKKKPCGISMGLGFWSGNFQGVSHNFAEFPGAIACFFLNFQGKLTNLKIPGGFSKKVYPQLVLLGFFMEWPIFILDTNDCFWYNFFFQILVLLFLFLSFCFFDHPLLVSFVAFHYFVDICICLLSLVIQFFDWHNI